MTQVLVVDDDDDIRTLVAELLRLSGYEVVAASSGVVQNAPGASLVGQPIIPESA